MNLTDYIPTGKENAIKSKELAQKTGCKSVRELQELIHRERSSGEVICSTCYNGGGYYLPADPMEVREFLKTLENRAKHTIVATNSAKAYLEQHGTDV